MNLLSLRDITIWISNSAKWCAYQDNSDIPGGAGALGNADDSDDEDDLEDDDESDEDEDGAESDSDDGGDDLTVATAMEAV